jgi:recombinational DNA repair protein RecR
MGYYVISNLINRKDNMSKENITTRELIQSITNKDSLTAVRVAMNINDLQDKTIEKTINVIQDMDKNMKLLAIKVMELEKRLEMYERPKN